MYNFPCFVINLETNTARMADIRARLNEAGLNHIRIDSVDGRRHQADDYDEYDRALGKKLYGRKISGAETACFLSHRIAAQEFIKTDADVALVFEDDAVLPADFGSFVGALTRWLQTDYAGQWDVVNFGRSAVGPFSPLPCTAEGAMTAGLGVCHAFPLTTTGLLWSRTGAEYFLAASAKIYAPVDQFLCDIYASNSRGLGFLDAPIRASGVPSDINYRFWQRVLDTKDITALLTKVRRLKRNKALSEATKAAFSLAPTLRNSSLPGKD